MPSPADAVPCCINCRDLLCSGKTKRSSRSREERFVLLHASARLESNTLCTQMSQGNFFDASRVHRHYNVSNFQLFDFSRFASTFLVARAAAPRSAIFSPQEVVMTKQKFHYVALAVLMGVLALWNVRAFSRYEDGDTPGEHPGIVPCNAKLAYESAVALAESADAQYRKIPEPQWSKLSFKGKSGNPESRPTDYLRELKAEIHQVRQGGGAAAAEAEKNYQSALARFESTNEKYAAKTTQTSKLTREIRALMVEIGKIDDLLAKNSANPTSPEEQERKTKIGQYETKVAAAQTKIEKLVGTDDMDEAKKRVADPKFKEFSNDTIRNLKRLWDETPPASPEFQAIDGRLAKAIEDARQDARNALSEYTTASRALSKLQSAGNSRSDDDAAGDAEREKLRGQKAAKRKLIEAKTAQKAKLGLQKPTGEDLSAAFESVKTAEQKREQSRKSSQRLAALESDLKAVEPWIVARMVRSGTEARRQKAQREYSEAIKIKDERLAQVQARFNALQSWINTQRAGLQGRAQDEAYWKSVSGLKSRASSEYSDMEADLSGMDCFPDVANLLNEIRARRKNVAAIKIGKAVKKPTTDKKPPAQANAGDISGWWVWLRGSDRVPMILEKNDNGQFNGVYFPGITTRKIVRGQGPTVHIGFAPLGGGRFRYRYKYPGSGAHGGKGGGVMQLRGNRMTGGWADDEGGAKGTWTLERATASERQLLKSKIGNRG
jgi:hypothetical protein